MLKILKTVCMRYTIYTVAVEGKEDEEEEGEGSLG